MTTHLSYRPEPRPQTAEHLRAHSRACAAVSREMYARGELDLARRAARMAVYHRSRRALKIKFDRAGSAPSRARRSA
jgi:hypothetical protein